MTLKYNKPLAAIVAVDINNGIGKGNKLLWHLPDDLKFFKKITMGKSVLMGRKTYQSIGKALPGRNNIVITRNSDFNPSDALIFRNILDALDYLEQTEQEAVIIGGGEIYRQTLPYCSSLYITAVEIDAKAEVFFTGFNPEEWELKWSEKHNADEKHAYAFTLMLFERKS